MLNISCIICTHFPFLYHSYAKYKWYSLHIEYHSHTKYLLYGTIPVPSLYHSHAKYKLYSMHSTFPIPVQLLYHSCTISMLNTSSNDNLPSTFMLAVEEYSFVSDSFPMHVLDCACCASASKELHLLIPFLMVHFSHFDLVGAHVLDCACCVSASKELHLLIPFSISFLFSPN